MTLATLPRWIPAPPRSLRTAEELAAEDRQTRTDDIETFLGTLSTLDSDWRIPVPLVRADSWALLARCGGFRRYAEHWVPRDGNLLLCGNTGAGKTSTAAYAAIRIAKAWAAKSDSGLHAAKRIRWVTAASLGAARRESALGKEVDLIERAKGASLLVLDDIGQSSERDDLFDVLDHRYVRGLPVLATSGLSLAELKRRFTTELVRRILEGKNTGTAPTADGARR